MFDQVSRYGVGEPRNSAGVAYIYAPVDLNRNAYVKSCVKSGRVTILTIDSERIDNVHIAKGLSANIDFPEASGGTGSLVVWVNVPKHEHPIVVGVLTSKRDMGNQTETSHSYRRRARNGSGVSIFSEASAGTVVVELSSLSKTGLFSLSVDGSLNMSVINAVLSVINKLTLAVAGGLILKSKGDTLVELASLSTIVSGSISIDATDQDIIVKLKTQEVEAEHLKYTASDGIELDADVKVGSGASPAVKSTNLKTLLSQLINLIATSSCPPNSPLTNAPAIAQLAQSLNDIDSEKLSIE